MRASLDSQIDMALDTLLSMMTGPGAPTKAQLRAQLEMELAAALAANPPQFAQLPAGFSAPVSALPAVCAGVNSPAETLYGVLDQFIDEVSDLKTFEAWLAS